MSIIDFAGPELKRLRIKMRLIVWSYNLQVIYTAVLIAFDIIVEVLYKIFKWTVLVLFLGLVVL